MPSIGRALIEKIEALPAERIAELEDFVELLHVRERERAFDNDRAGTSPPGFAEARDKPEYDPGGTRIGRDPNIMMGKPVIAGTRITVEHILRLLGAGDTVADILRNHPQITEADVHAAQVYAADCLAHERISAAG